MPDIAQSPTRSAFNWTNHKWVLTEDVAAYSARVAVLTFKATQLQICLRFVHENHSLSCIARHKAVAVSLAYPLSPTNLLLATNNSRLRCTGMTVSDRMPIAP
jgi:hypothetical protein